MLISNRYLLSFSSAYLDNFPLIVEFEGFHRVESHEGDLLFPPSEIRRTCLSFAPGIGSSNRGPSLWIQLAYSTRKQVFTKSESFGSKSLGGGQVIACFGRRIAQTHEEICQGYFTTK
jgi:hypothetical protein